MMKKFLFWRKRAELVGRREPSEGLAAGRLLLDTFGNLLYNIIGIIVFKEEKYYV